MYQMWVPRPLRLWIMHKFLWINNLYLSHPEADYFYFAASFTVK
jgi:hypothetical protein